MTTLRKLGAKLFDQQMWCWGCDIRRAEGNLLLAYGFERQRPVDRRTSSAYIYHTLDGRQIVLWGFGAFWGMERIGGLYVPRDGFRSYLVSGWRLPSDVWPDKPAPRRDHDAGDADLLAYLLAQFATWIAAYERWIQQSVGSAYRIAALHPWRRKMVVAGDAMAGAWGEVADRMRLR